METTPQKLTAPQRAKAAKMQAILKSEDELSAAVSRYATLELLTEALNTETEAEVKAIMERSATQRKALEAESSELFEQIETYTRRNRRALFVGDDKSTMINGHRVSLRTSPPKVDTVKGVTQKQVLSDLLQHTDEAWADAYVRWSEALNKERILEDWDTTAGTWKPGAEGLGELGIEITQSEVFELKTARVLSAGKATKGTAAP